MTFRALKMTALEKRAALGLGGIYGFRMLGLFMVLPIFVFYATELKGSTPFLMGLAMGIYGFTQAIFQIPFGMLSDRWGRKPVILMGLLLFALGSVVAACSHGIGTLILGRALQGTGAVGSTLIALLTDLTREEHRGKAMALIGMIIGLSFPFSMLLGPLLNHYVGIHGIFFLTAALAVVGMILLVSVVPHPQDSLFHHDALPEPRQFRGVLSHGDLLRLDGGIFILHAVLTASFIGIPVALKEMTPPSGAHEWMFYFPVLVFSFLTMIPCMILAEKKQKIKECFLGAIILLFGAEISMIIFSHSFMGMGISLYFFFTGFLFLEASLPALISKTAPPGSKGTAMGVYSSSQFLGIFLGGALGGWLFGAYGLKGICVTAASVLCLWFFMALTMKRPRPVGTLSLPIAINSLEEVPQLKQGLKEINGVIDAFIHFDEKIAYVKVDNSIINLKDLQSFSTN